MLVFLRLKPVCSGKVANLPLIAALAAQSSVLILRVNYCVMVSAFTQLCSHFSWLFRNAVMDCCNCNV
jgi:hypothetical protein